MRFAVLASLVFAAAVAAAPAPAPGGHGSSTVNQCKGGKTYCCNSFSQPVDAATGNLLSVPLNVIASLNCSPISVLAIVAPLTCPSSTVCCQDVGTNGLVNVQCVGLAV